MLTTFLVVDAFCIILAISMYTHINRDFGSEFEVKSLRRALLSYCGFLLTGLLGIFVGVESLAYIKEVIWIANILSLLLLILVAYFWFMFATARLHNRFPDTWIILLARIPIVLAIVLCATSPLTGYIFFIDAQGDYQRGPLFVFIYLPVFLYGLLVSVQAIAVGARSSEFEKKRECFSMGLFIVFPAIAGALQMYLANTPILAPSIITAFFLVFIQVQSFQIYNDALTGLNNRRRARQYLEEQISVSSEQKPLTVFLMDINSFKQINDKYGHAEGDNALKIVSASAVKLCQQYRIFAARYGGDEFILVAAGHHSNKAEEIIRAFRELLQSECQERHVSYALSVSIGHTVTHDNTETIDHVVNRADKALYEDKHRYHSTTA